MLGIHQTTGRVLVRLKDAASELKLNDVSFSRRYVPETCLPTASFAGTSAPELIVVGIHDSTAGVLARYKDASSREKVSEVDFSANYPPDAVVMVPDVGGSAADDIALLGTHVATGDILIRVKDSATGELIAVIRIP